MKTGGSAEENKRRNLERYGSRISRFRRRAGMTADELAGALGLSVSSVRNWECGLTRPDPEALYRMFSILDVEPNEFYGIQSAGNRLTPEERRLVEDYRALDEAGREDAGAILAAMAEGTSRRRLRTALDRMTAVPDWGRYASAGDGAEWPERPEREDVLLYAGGAAAAADEVITITGRSMEPQLHSGERVLVAHCTDLRNGDIGIFYVPGLGGVVKQKAYDRLHSLNPEYDDIFPQEEGAVVIGRVIGAVSPEMIPTKEDAELYREALREQGK